VIVSGCRAKSGAQSWPLLEERCSFQSGRWGGELRIRLISGATTLK